MQATSLHMMVEGVAVLTASRKDEHSATSSLYSGCLFNLAVCNAFGVYIGLERAPIECVLPAAATRAPPVILPLRGFKSTERGQFKAVLESKGEDSTASRSFRQGLWQAAGSMVLLRPHGRAPCDEALPLSCRRDQGGRSSGHQCQLLACCA